MTKLQRTKLEQATIILTEYLMNGTDFGFEEIPEIDEARELLMDIEEEEVKSDTWHTRKFRPKVTTKE